MRTNVVVVAAAALSLIAGCQNDLVEVDDHGDAAAAGAFEVVEGSASEQAMVRSCKPAATVKGVDVSYYQERINWASVKAAGVDYAFIRVSDGSTFIDPRFEENWRGARAAGVKRGAYQFFRSNKDPIVQADLLLEHMGPLEDGDLPPVIDVESTDGQSKATIIAKVQRWVDRVEAVLGVKPIIYTGPYFWQDQVGSRDFGEHPLWIAHYGTDCPLIPAPWTRYNFHQFTDSGRVNGIPGNVDTNTFAGTRADLEALSFHTGSGTVTPPPPSSTCEKIPAAGRVVDEEDACFFAGGPTEYLRAESGEGHGGGLVWTHATNGSARENYGEWTLRMDVAGSYKISVWTDSSVATSQLARYRVEHDGVVGTQQVDQRSVEGWRPLGTFELGAGTAKIVLNDNTGEALSGQKKIVFDAVKIEPTTTTPPPAPAPTCTRVKVVNADALNVRTTASTSMAAIGSLRSGDVVDRLSSVEGQSISGNRTWHRIQKGSLSGYVSAYYMTCMN
ncbi:MAG: GH25 family lysozyme [Deltaproteobacteria bacterium]|nr:GH25 family lysozyme [Deltaproteobacteria bacterium]